MQAVILAAGRSNRFYPFTSFGHKSMVPLLGKPLLQHTLESLKIAHITNVIIVTSDDSKIPSNLQEIPGLTITYITQDTALGMGHALLQAEKHLEEEFLLIAGYHVDVNIFIREMEKKKKDSKHIVLLAKEDNVVEKYGVVEVEGDKVLSVIEKPAENSGLQYRLISIYLLNKQFLLTLSKLPVSQYHFEKALDEYAKTGNTLFVKTDKPSVTLKHSWDLLTVKDYLLSKLKRKIAKSASIAKSAILEGEIVIEDSVVIMEGACVKGPAYLGKRVMIGNNAILRNGVIVEENVVIGATMEAKNTIFMKGATTHTGFIGDSIIGQNSRIAAGFCTANVRLDRKEVIMKILNISTNTHRTHIGCIIGNSVDVGTNVSTMPGICIGNNTTIGPSTVVMENVEDDMLMYTKFKTIVKKSVRQAQDENE